MSTTLKAVPVVSFALMIKESKELRHLTGITSWPTLPAIGTTIEVRGTAFAQHVAQNDLGAYKVIDHLHMMDSENPHIQVILKRKDTVNAEA